MSYRESARTVVTGLWSGWRGWLLVAISVGQLLAIGTRLTFPAVLPQIKEEFILTNTTAGILLSVLWVSYATAQLPGGILADRVGERNTLVASMVLILSAITT